jgi:DnaJ-class molecular chaperone
MEILLSLVERCPICGGKGFLGKLPCNSCRGVGYRVSDKGAFRATAQRLGK